jgi:uncharacterized membrane protein YkoI
MKKTVVVLICLILTGLAFAQKIQENSIPQTILSAVKKQYPQAEKIKWEKENEHYEAEFKQNEQETSILLDSQGNILETETEITPDLLPPKVQEYVSKQYPNQKIKEASKITDAKGKISYEVEIKKTDLYFDQEGNFIQIKTK